MKVLKIMLPIMLAITLVAGMGLTGVAAQEPDQQETPKELQTDNPQPENALKALGNRLRGLWGGKQTENPRPNLMPRFRAGEVIEVDEANSCFVIQRGENEPVRIAVDNGTKYYIVRALKNIAGLVRNRAGLNQGNQTDVTTAETTGLAGVAGQLRQRVAAVQQNGSAGNGVKRGPVNFNLMNAGQVRKMNGFNQMKSTPMANPQALQVRDGNADTGSRAKRFGKEATFADIEVGDRVVVRLVPGDEKPVARLVLIHKPSPYKAVGGTITEVSPDNKTITIAPVNDGEPVTLRYNEDTLFYLKGIIAVEPGQLARAAYLVEGMMAKAVKVFPEGTELNTPETE